MSNVEQTENVPEQLRSWLGCGVKWRKNGEKIHCNGEVSGHKHRATLMLLVDVMPVEHVEPAGEPHNASYVLVLQCPTCKHTTFQHTCEVEPCGADAAEAFPVRCDPPTHTLMRAMADGRDFRHWKHATDMLVHQAPDNPNGYVQAPFEECEAVFVESLIRNLDADSCIIAMGVLATVLKGTEEEPKGVLVDIYETAIQSGLVRNRHQFNVEVAMRKVWNAVYALTRLKVSYNPGKIRDPRTKQIIATIDRASPLMLAGERDVDPRRRNLPPQQLSIWEQAQTPIAVWVMLNPHWRELLTSFDRGLYIAGGEVLAKFPPRQTAGAWARVMGLLLLGQFRWQRGKPVTTTRRYLLTTLPPAKTPVEPLLSDHKTRKRAQEYWNRALRLLVNAGIVASPPADDTPVNGDPDAWLDAKLTFAPGELVQRQKGTQARSVF